MDIDQKSLERAREQLALELQGRTLFDDKMVRLVLRNNTEVAKAILAPILGREDFKIISVSCQDVAQAPNSHSVWFDAVAKFDDGTVVDIEVQQRLDRAPKKRMRYYSSMLDISSLETGKDYRELHPCIVIFIVRGDVGGARLPIYHIRRIFQETGNEFGDESEIIIVNVNCSDESTSLGKVMHDLKTQEPEDMCVPVIKTAVERVKYAIEEGTMDEELYEIIKTAMPEAYNEAVAKGREQGLQEGREQGLQQGQRSAILSLVRDGSITLEKAASVLGISEKEVQALLDA